MTIICSSSRHPENTIGLNRDIHTISFCSSCLLFKFPGDVLDNCPLDTWKSYLQRVVKIFILKIFKIYLPCSFFILKYIYLYVSRHRVQIIRKCISCLLFIAAHCLKLNRLSNDTIHPNVLLVALGRFNLREWRETGTETREVKSYKIHPEFAHTDSGDSDIAILVLRTSVDYSPVIKPICLWTGSINLENIIGKTGIVVGWGIDESGNYTTEPRMVRVPIVSQVRIFTSFLLL